MRMRSLATGVVLALACSAGKADAVADVAAKREGSNGRYIVHLSYPAVAVFDAAQAKRFPALKSLQTTRVDEGQRLRVDSAAAKAYRSVLHAQQDDVLRGIETRVGRDLEPALRMDVVLNAMVLELSEEEATQIAKLDGVAKVEADWVARPQTDAGPRWINAESIWDGSAGTQTRGEGVVIGVIDTGINPTHASFAARGVSDGFTHTNPMPGLVTLCSGSAPPCNSKLIGIRDFTTGSSSAEPDDGLDVDGHGSHVASTAAGNTLNVTLTLGNASATRVLSGVAPHANLISYKACEEEADCLGSWLLAAINAAVADGVDVINYSIGGSARDPWTVSDAQAMLAARSAGTVVVVAAGNEGPGAGSLTSPANAPWVLAVANATHDRDVGSRLLDFSGGSGALPGGGSVFGAGTSGGYGPQRIVIPNDYPGCGVGDGLGTGSNNQPDGSSNPWAGQSNRFNGEIVVCQRGTQARIAKSDNVRRAGGGGMVLINSVGDGEGIVADSHSIPSTHLGYQAGEALRQWLLAGGQSARIESAQLVQSTTLADRLAASSGRGPVSLGAIMKPNVTAPGTSIIAAAGTGSDFALMSGTSMASPHVAGAAALLRAAKPNWSVGQIESALQTSARAEVRLQDGVSPAGGMAAGAGMVNLTGALRGGLFVAASDQDMRNANPATSGDPAALNLPGIALDPCLDQCTTSRVVTDQVGGGRWRVESSLDDGTIQVTPSEFSLNPGASQRLDIQIDLRGIAEPNRWVDGEIRLVPATTSVTTTRLPVTVFASAGVISEGVTVTTQGDKGFVDLPVVDLTGVNTFAAVPWIAYSLPQMPDALFTASGWAPPLVERAPLAQDPTPGEIYDQFATGTLVRTLSVPAATGSAATSYHVRVSIGSSTATDLDLFVGNDFDGDGLPSESEQLCASSTATASERCELDVLRTGSPQTLWVLVQNWQAGSSGTDEIELDMLAYDDAGADSDQTVVTAPNQVSRADSYNVRLAWDDTQWLPGESRRTVLTMRTRPDAAPFAHVPVTLTRATQDGPAARALTSGETVNLVLSAGQSHERLFIDVPQGSTRLDVTQTGTGEVDLYLARDPSATGPAISAAPTRGSAATSDTTAGAGATLSLSGAALTAGRWYVTPVNRGTAPASIALSATLRRTSAVTTPRFGAYFNPQRSGSGIFFFPVASTQWGVIWYTYLEDGTPTWYIAAAPAPTATNGQWQSAVTRHVWNGSASRGTEIGTMQLSVRDAQHLQFTFDIDGVTGSEQIEWLPLAGCAQPAGQSSRLDGFWFDQNEPGHGYSVLAGASLQSVANYLYDDMGVARWTLGTGNRGNGAMPMLQFQGFCPTCTYVEPTYQTVGQAVLTLPSATQTDVTVTNSLQLPLSGDWNRDHTVQLLSDAVGCFNP